MHHKNKKIKRFKPLSKEDEITLLTSDDTDFSSTQLYLMPLIVQAIGRMTLSDKEAQRIRNALLADIPVAAHRFLRSRTEATAYRFATYFTWYIQKRIEE